MHRTLDDTRGLVDPSRFYEIHYEQLVADPVGQLRTMYDHLGLGEFDKVAPAIQQYQDARADYKAKRYQMSPAERETINRHWAPYIEKYGYRVEQPGD
jgi:LPS sulfotransferase NodH